MCYRQRQGVNKKSLCDDDTHEIYNYWNKQAIVVHKKCTVGMKKKIAAALKDYTVEEIKEAIKNYEEILHSPDYFWNYVWTLMDFCSRGIHKFLNEAKPYDNFFNKKLGEKSQKQVLKDFENLKNKFLDYKHQQKP